MMLKLKICIAAFFLCQLTLSQQPVQQQQIERAQDEKPRSKTAETKVKPKIPAKDKQLALQMLEISDAQARGFEAPMRSYSLLQIAQVYVTIDPEKARGLLGDAFTASVGIQDDDDTKAQVQEEIFRALLPLSQADVEERLSQAELSVRKQTAESIVRRYADKKQFEPAIELINQVTGWDEFPYESGTQLLLAMPAEMSSEKLSLFTQAINSYKNHEHNKRIMMGDGSLTNMVVRFGAKMPARLVMEAIDEILSQAKKMEGHNSITLGSQTGTAAFNSSYDFELFALLPTLQLLDEGRAESLLKENQDLKAKLQQFPSGLQSLDPGLTDAPPKKGAPGMSVMVGMGGSGPMAGGGAYMLQEYQRKAQAIADDSVRNPTQAIAQAATLPVKLEGPGMSPRAQALEQIARINAKESPGSAKQALDELRKVIVDLPLRNQIQFLAAAANIYLQIGEKESAETVVGEGFKVAEKLLAKDMGADDPNKGLKAWWPSADAYCRFMEVEARISQRSAAKILKEIGDPEIRTSASIMFSRTLLDLPMKRFVVTEKRKNMNMTFVSSDEN